MASGPDQKNPSKKERESTRRDRGEFQMSLIERVMRQFEEARRKGNEANERRYQQILRGYDQLTNEQKADLEGLNEKHSGLIDNLANMSGDVVQKMKDVASGTAKDVLGDVSDRTDKAAGKYDQATSQLGQLAQQAGQRVGDAGQAASDRVAEQGTQSREGVLERGSKDLQNLAQQYRDAEGDIASDIRQGRGRIDEGYGNLLTRDQRRRDLGRREARSEFTNQETQAESRYGQARDTAGQAFDDARQRVGDSAGQQVSEAGQRSQAGRGTVASDFDTATAKAQQIADQGTASAQDIGGSALQDLSARAEGRLGNLGEGYGQLGQQAQQQAQQTGTALGNQYRSLANQAGERITGAMEDTRAGFDAGRGRVTEAFGAAADDRAARYGQRTETGLSMYDQMGQASADRINRQFDEQIERTMGQMEQNLINRGLDSTTIRGQLDRARSDIERNRSEALAQVDAQVRQEKAGAFERMTAQGMSSQDAMEASGLNVDAQMTGAGLSAEQNLRNQSLAQQAAMNQAAVAEQGAGMKRGEQAAMQTGLAGLAQQAAGQQAISAAEQAVGRQSLAGALQAQGQGTAAQLGMQGQKAAGLAQLTGQQLDAQKQLAAQGLQGQNYLESARAAGQQQLAGQQAGSQQQAGMAGAAANQQMIGQNLAAGTAAEQAGLAARERGQAALEGATQQSRLAGLSAQAQGLGRLGQQDAAMEGARFGAMSGLEGQRFGQMAGLESQGLAAQSGNVAQGAAAFDRGQQQASNIQAQLAGQGMGAQTGQMAQGFGTQAQLGSNAVSALERGMQRGDQTKQNTLDFMERKQEDIPPFETAAQLALAAGQSGMGSGGDPAINPALGKAMDQIGANQRWMQGQLGQQGQREQQNQKFNLDLIKLWGDQRQKKDEHVAEVNKDRDERNAAINKDLRNRDDKKYEDAINDAMDRESEYYRKIMEQQDKLEQLQKDHKEEIEGLTGKELEAVKAGHAQEISAIERGLQQTVDAYNTSNQAIIDLAGEAVKTPPGQPVNVTVNQSVEGGTTNVEGSSFQGGQTTLSPGEVPSNQGGFGMPTGSGLPGPDIGVGKGDLTSGGGGYPTMGGGRQGTGEVVLDPEGNPIPQETSPTTSPGDNQDPPWAGRPIHYTNPPRWADTGEVIPPDIWEEIRNLPTGGDLDGERPTPNQPQPNQPQPVPDQPTDGPTGERGDTGPKGPAGDTGDSGKDTGGQAGGGGSPTGPYQPSPGSPYRPFPGTSPLDPWGTPTTGGGTGLPPGHYQDENGSIRDKDGKLVNGGFGESPGYDPNQLPDPTRPWPDQRDPYRERMDQFPMDPNPGQQHLDTPIPLEPNVPQDGSLEGMPYKNFAEYQQFMMNQLNPTRKSLREEAAQRPKQPPVLDEDGLPPEGDPNRPQTKPGWGGGGRRMTPTQSSAGFMAPNVSNRMAAGEGLKGLAAQAQGGAAGPQGQAGMMGFAGGGGLNQLGDGPQVFGGQGPMIAANNPNQVPGPMQNPQNPQRPEGIGDFNQAEAEANAAALVNAQGAMDEADEGNEQMQEAMTGMNYLPSDFWAGGAGHTAAVNAGLAQQQAAARAMWEEGKARQQELIDKINQQLGEHYGGGGGWGGGSGGGGGTWDEGGGGDDGGGRGERKRPPVWGEPGSNPRDTEGGRGGPVFGDPTRPGGKTPPWMRKDDPLVLGMPPGIPGSNTTGGIADAYLERKRREQEAGGGQGGDWNSQGNKQKGGDWQDNINTGHPAPSIHGSIPPPQQGGKLPPNFWSHGQGDPMPQGGGSNNVGQGDLPFGVDASLPAPQGGGQQGGGGWQRQDNQGQQFLDNLRRQFETMTPQERMQNAGNFQRDMDRWQTNFGEGGNTREQVDLFNQIKEGTGSQRLRGFPDQNNPMQFNDRQLREQSDARLSAAERKAEHRQRQKDWMDNRSGSIFAPSQASRMPQGPEQKQELPMFGQEGYGDMIRQRRQQQGNPNSLEALRQRATSPQQRIATNKQYPTGSQFAGTRPSTRTGTAGLNTLSKQAKPRMSLPQLYRK